MHGPQLWCMPLTFNRRQNPPTYAGQMIRRLLLRGNPFLCTLATDAENAATRPSAPR